MTLTLVAAAVALATCLLSAVSMVGVAVRQSRDSAKVAAETLYHQARSVIRAHPAAEVEAALASDPALRSYLQAAVGYSKVTVYLAVLDNDGRAILHSDPSRQGERIPPEESIDAFSRLPGLAQLWRLTRGHRVLAYNLPFTVDGDGRFGTVRVTISSLLLREQIAAAITWNVAIVGVVVVLVFGASFYLANRLLAPLEMLRRQLAGIEVGGERLPLDLRSAADVNRVAEFFASVTRQLDEERRRDADPISLDATLGALTDAVLVVNRRHEVVSLNRPARELFEHGEPLQGRSIDEIAGGSHPLSSLIRDTLATGGPVGPRHVNLPSERGEASFRMTAQVLREGEEVTGVVVTCQDLEKLARLGDRLFHAQKLSALGELTSGVAHEIKNPLNAMVLHAELLRESIGEGDDGRHVEVIEREIRRLEQVVDGFLKFTRPEVLKLGPVRLESVIDEVLGLLAGVVNLGRVEIHRRFAGDLPPILGDADLLRQLFLNLALNACEAMPEGGHLDIEGARSDGERIAITFRDDGCGIPAEVLPKVFKLFCTTKVKGSGVGLSVVYRIVHLHGGEIGVDSHEGKGTAFRVLLPEARP